MDLQTFIVGLIAATLRVSTPLIFGTLGELVSERAGILNLGIEGTMLMGAFVGFIVTRATGSLGLGLAAAIVAGILAGLLMGLLTVTLGLNQHVSGLGMTLFLTGLALFLFRLILGGQSTQPSIDSFPKVAPFGDLPIIGPITNQYALTYVAILLVPVFWWLIYRTSFGLQVRAAGENPEAADAAGVNVYRTRYLALALAGGLMACGGAFLSIAQTGTFTFQIVNGRGWVCIALIIFANWIPARVLWGALLFGGVDALQLRLQSTGLDLPYELFLALTLAGRNVSGPAAVLKPYRRE